MDGLRIGVLGAARIVPMALLQPARRVSKVQVVAIATREPARAHAFAQKHAIPRVHAGYDALLDDGEINAVYIPLPNSLHALWAERALRAGKHVLCEKPLASNAAEAEALAAAVESTGQTFMEAFHWRYFPMAARMVALARATAMGPILSLRGRMRTPMLRREDIRFHYELGGGAAMDMGCYLVNMVRVVAGEEPLVEEAQATLLRPEVDRRMTARLAFPSGARATIDCEMGAWRWPQIDLEVSCRNGRFTAVNPILPHLHHALRVQDGSGRRREWFGRTPTYVYQLQEFAECVRTGRRPLSSAADGVLNMRVLDDIYRAAGLSVRGGAVGATRR